MSEQDLVHTETLRFRSLSLRKIHKSNRITISIFARKTD